MKSYLFKEICMLVKLKKVAGEKKMCKQFIKTERELKGKKETEILCSIWQLLWPTAEVKETSIWDLRIETPMWYPYLYSDGLWYLLPSENLGAHIKVSVGENSVRQSFENNEPFL